MVVPFAACEPIATDLHVTVFTTMDTSRLHLQQRMPDALLQARGVTLCSLACALTRIIREYILMRQPRLAAWMLAVVLLPAGISAESSGNVAVTIYQDDFGVVKEQREMEFEKGMNRLHFTGVAERMDPTSVSFTCLSEPEAVTILEQNFEYDLVGTETLLRRYIDHPVSLLVMGSGATGASRIQGVLAAATGDDLILQEAETGRMHIVSRASIERIELERKPEDLLTRPTLVWLAHATRTGSQRCQVAYTTDGIGWQADYTAVLNEREDALDLNGWVTINNQSGAAYHDAAIKLIAGDVRRVQPSPPPMLRERAMVVQADVRGFEERSFMEYHLYALGRRSTLQNRQIKQIELIDPARDVPVTKQLVFATSINPWLVRNRDKVQVKIEFDNEAEHGLGIALPRGKVRVFKTDPVDGTLEFVGEDVIDHTPRRERLSLYIGDAFDIVPEQKITDQQRGERFVTFTRSVEIRNRKEAPTTVLVDELVPRYVNWRIDRSALPYEQPDAFTCRFEVNVDADSSVTLTYTMTQTW